MAEQDTPTDRTLLFVGDGFTLGYDGIGEEIGVFADDVAADADNYALDEVSPRRSKTTTCARPSSARESPPAPLNATSPRTGTPSRLTMRRP
jgi:hypothetical protein